MGTHPIFESDFDCLTDMNRLNLNVLRRIVTASQTKPIYERNKCVIFMNGTRTKPECGAAGAMISILEVENVDFREVDFVNVDSLDLTTEERDSVPQIYFNGKSFGGHEELFQAYQNDEIRFILLKAGLTLPEKEYIIK